MPNNKVLGLLIFSVSVSSISASMEGTGSLSGRVTFQGIVPQEEILEVNENQDFCGESVVRQKVRVDPKNHGLQFAIVSLESLGAPLLRRTEARQALVINENCAFSPRIAAAQSLDAVEIRNQDPILHNTHISIKQRTFLNVAQLPGSRPINKILKQSGLHEVLCDKHKFMSGYLMVFDHPFFHVTNNKGEFEIAGIPPGKYIARVWHETLGIVESKVTISSEKTEKVNFGY